MRSITTAAALALAGCGTYPLGTVTDASGRSIRERDTDTMFCKDWAKTGTDTDGRLIVNFLAGLTVVGSPLATLSARSKQRELFAQCMAERGYAVEAK